MNLKTWALRLCAALFLMSCVSQKPPEVGPDRESGVAGLNCNLNILKGLLEHSNVVKLFPCLKWDRKYPQITQALSNVPAGLWNHIMLPLDAIFLADKEQRDRTISMIKDLDSRGGLDDLSEVFRNIFLDANFHDTLFRVLKEAEDNGQNGQSGPDILTKEDFKNIFALMNAPKQHFIDFASVLAGLNHASLGEDKDLKAPMQRLMKIERFKTSRINMIDAGMRSFKQAKLDARDRLLFSKIWTLQDSDSKKPILHQWMHRELFDLKTFKKILGFPFIEYPTMNQDLRIVIDSLPKVSCRLRGQSNHMDILIEEELKKYVLAMAEKPFDSFFELTMESLHKLNLADAACEMGLLIGEGDKTANLFDVFRKGNQLYALPPVFELIKIAHYLPTHYDRQNPAEADPFYLLKLITKDSMIGAQDFFEVLFEQKKDSIIDPFFYIMKSLPLSMYFSMANLLEYYLGPKIFPTIQGVTRFWDQLSPSNKESFMNVWDAHFAENVDYRLLRRFYQSMIDDFPKVAPRLARAIVGNDKNREYTFQALKLLAYHMRGGKILEELRQFYSRDGILKVVEIISRSASPGGPGLPGGDAPTPPAQTDPIPGVPPIVIVPPTSDQNQRQRAYATCIEDISASGAGLYNAIFKFPESCREIETDSFTHEVFEWAHDIAIEFNQTFPGRNLFTPEGILGKEMLNHGVSTGLIFERTLKSLDNTQTGWDYFFSVLKNQLYDLPQKEEDGNGYINLFNDLLKYSTETLQRPHPDLETFQRTALKELAASSPTHMKSLVRSLGIVLEDYSFSTIQDHHYKETIPCSIFKVPLDAPPCPALDQVQMRAKRYIDMLKVNYPDVPTTTDLLVDALIPGVGIALPFEHKEKLRYVLTPEETLFMFWDAIDPKYDKKIKFQGKNDKKKKKVTVSLVERLESTIREASFNVNFIGIFYKNSIIKTLKYSKEAKKHHTLFKVCLLIRWCGMPINKEHHRMGKNAVVTFESLRTLNEEFPHEHFRTMKYGRWIQTFISTMVASSHKNAHKSATFTIKIPGFDPLHIPHFLPYEDRIRHKGMMFTELNYVSAIRNLSRIIRDRFGKDEKTFTDFIKSYEFRRVNRKLFKSFPREYTQEIFNRIVSDHTGGKDNILYTIVEDTINYLYHQEYDDIRTIEDTLGNLLVLSTYLGNDGQQLINNGDGLDTDLNDPRYATLGTHRFLDVIELAVNIYPVLKKHWPEDVKLVDVLRPVNRFLRFVKFGLHKDRTKSKRLAYFKSLNDSFLVFDKLFLKQKDSPLMGLHLFLDSFKEKPDESIFLARRLHRFIDRLHYFRIGQYWNEDRSRFLELAQNFGNIARHRHFKTGPFSNYLKTASLKLIRDENGDLVENPVYLGPFNLFQFLSESEYFDGPSRFENLSETILIERKRDILDLMDETFQLIEFNDEKYLPKFAETHDLVAI